MTKTQTVMCVKNAAILARLELVRSEVKDGLACRRQPGVQVVLDLLLQFYLAYSKDQREAFIRQWVTEIVGYPNSSSPNPGSFA
ncbi:MAG: hypothetical protein V3S98_06175 [Dehalococcoidia bacterium]